MANNFFFFFYLARISDKKSAVEINERAFNKYFVGSKYVVRAWSGIEKS